MRIALAVAYGLGAGAMMGLAHHHLLAWTVAGAALGGALGLAAQGRRERLQREQVAADETEHTHPPRP